MILFIHFYNKFASPIPCKYANKLILNTALIVHILLNMLHI